MKKPINVTDFGKNFMCEAPSKRIPSNDPHRKNGKLIRMVTLQCENCNRLFDIPMSSAKRTKQKCCGIPCYKKLIEVFNGGNEKHPLYTRWLAMKQRCLNPSHSSFKNYGKKGISIEGFFMDFVNYAQYVTQLPGYNKKLLKYLSLDRVDSSKGYTRNNLRWTNHSIQVVNQHKRQNSSGYKGIAWNKNKKTWLARVTYKGVTYINSTHKKLEEAVKARNESIRVNRLPHEIQKFK